MTAPRFEPVLLPVATAPNPESPRWWVDVLYKRLMARKPEVDFYDDYYSGEHPLPWLAPQARDEFRRILKMTRSNYMSLVVNAKAQRMGVGGFRVADNNGEIPESADANLWRIWQANDLDSDSDLAWVEALVSGQSYMMVAPNGDDPATPIITVEHASQVIVAYEAGTNRRKARAALKVWADEWTGEYQATLYLPDRLYKVEADKPPTGAGNEWHPQWRIRRGSDDIGEGNPLGVVPIAEITLAPRLLTGGRSFLADVTDIQDRINKTVADRLMTQDFGAFPQKWASGWPEEDQDGNPTPRIEVGRDRMVTTDATEAKFGQWDAALLDPYSNAKREDVKDVASLTCTPVRSLLGEMSNVNGETLKASESDHIAVIKQMSRYAENGVERAMRLAQRAAGLAPDVAMETIWINPEYRTEGEITDAIIKRVSGRISSVRQGREDYGYTPSQIRRLEADDAAAAASLGLSTAAALFAQGEADSQPA